MIATYTQLFSLYLAIAWFYLIKLVKVSIAFINTKLCFPYSSVLLYFKLTFFLCSCATALSPIAKLSHSLEGAKQSCLTTRSACVIINFLHAIQLSNFYLTVANYFTDRKFFTLHRYYSAQIVTQNVTFVEKKAIAFLTTLFDSSLCQSNHDNF